MSPIDQLRLAFPDASDRTLRRLLGKARAQARVLAAAEAKALRFDERKVCRRLHFQGWEHLHATRESGGLLLLPKLGARRLAHRALDLYLPGLRWVEKERGISSPKADILRTSNDQDTGRGGILAMDFDLSARAGGAATPFLGRQAQIDPRVAQIATGHGLSILPVLCLPFAQGRFHLAFHQAIRIDGVANIGVLATWLEDLVRHHPEHWDWQET